MNYDDIINLPIMCQRGIPICLSQTGRHSSRPLPR